MSLQQLFTSRKPYAASTFVAGKGKIFYDETSGYLRIGDGHTAGGHAIGLPQASTSTFGGVKLGPGVILNGDNQIIIDSSGLSFNFGDFQATTPGDGAATLSSINENQNVNIVSNGTGAINCIGNFHVHTTASYDPEVPDSDGAIFRVSTEGQVRMLVPTANSVTGAVEIVGSLSGEYQTPVNTGVMLHVTGQLSDANRLYFDGNNGYVVVTGRRYNGTAIAPTAVLNNDIIVRYGANAYNGTAWNSGGVARMEINATENHDVGGQGTNIKFYTTTKRASTQTARLILDEAGATIQSGGSFIGPLTGNVTGTATTATYAQSFNTSTLITTAVSAVSATTSTSAATAYSLANTSTTYVGRASLADTATTSTNAAFAYSFNTSTLVTTAVLATTATNAAFAYSFNTSTLVTNAVTAQTAGTVTTAAQPAITSVGTLTSLSVSGNIRYDQTQNNGTATQITSKSTSVTCNGRTGQITTNGAALNKGVAVKFTVNNSYITSAKDVIIVNIASGATVPYSVSVNAVSASGSFDITLNNADGTGSGANASDTLVINFAVIKVS